MTFEGFPEEGLAFLTELGSQNKAWFDDHRPVYKATVADPAKLFVTALGNELQTRISDEIEAQPKTNGSIGPINNDLRFSPDASPYKDHLLFRFWEGPSKKVAPTLFVRMSPSDGIGFAAGLMFADVKQWRSLIDDEQSGGRLASSLAALVTETGADVVGQALKKVPKPYSPDHPRADLLRHKMIQARWVEPTPANISSADFVDFCATQLTRCAPVHDALLSFVQ